MTNPIGRLLRGFRAGADKAFYRRFDAPQTISLDSPAFADGAVMPQRFLGPKLGGNVSPPLIWSGLPEASLSVLLVIEDVDVPFPVPLVHGLAYFEAGRVAALSEGVVSESAPAGVVVGRNSLGGGKYMGPAPIPGHGPHHYVFQMFALDVKLPLSPGFKRKQLPELIKNHVAAIGILTGVCERE